MLELLIRLYVALFARIRFAKINKLLYRLSLAGLGVLNYKTSALSGERSFLKSYLPGRSGVLIDVGANVGGYTREALQCNPEIKVFAFEPHPKTYQILKADLQNISNVTVVNKGCSSTNGILHLYDYAHKDGSAHASLYSDVITRIHKSQEVVSHQVEVITLDQFVEDTNIAEIALLKIDTEGNELEVLRGGRPLLRRESLKRCTLNLTR